MHIGFVVGNYLPHSGGVQNHVASLAQQLKREDVEVTVFNVEPEGERLVAGIPVIGLGRHAAVGDIAAFPNPGSAVGLPRKLTETGVSVVSVHTRFFPATWLGIAAARRAGIPSVLTEHGGGHVQAAGAITRGATLAIDKSVGRWAWRSADALLAVSQRSADFIHSQSGRRAAVCGNGIDVDWWRADGPVTDVPRLVFVGRLVPEKGWRTFVDLARSVPSDVDIRILGDGPDMAALRTEISRSGLVDRIEVLGHASAEEVRHHLRGAVLVNPSVASEGLQTTLLEGAAAGARIVTYDVGGASETQSTGAQVWIVGRGDSTGLASGIRAALASRWTPAQGLDRFSWGEVARRYMSAFEDAVEHRRPARDVGRDTDRLA
jgi:glycosyltransferase involved in cell wall biosynthesis